MLRLHLARSMDLLVGQAACIIDARPIRVLLDLAPSVVLGPEIQEVCCIGELGICKELTLMALFLMTRSRQVQAPDIHRVLLDLAPSAVL
jgi:hypothetical protein